MAVTMKPETVGRDDLLATSSQTLRGEATRKLADSRKDGRNRWVRVEVGWLLWRRSGVSDDCSRLFREDFIVSFHCKVTLTQCYHVCACFIQ